ncbi:hypothetical protein M422DRAFT_73927 [Sphaerobolus stellatus SS14]|nr:hypothetical protein M422DRAFT_73927 [Sphaerobolus stellatus SS14]
MADFQLVDPKEWKWDLQSIYSAYINHFQAYDIPWYDKTWGHLFTSFEAFLEFGWPVITVSDASTGRAHIVTRMSSLASFLKMIKTRFGELLPVADNILQVTSFETHNRHIRRVIDAASYKKLHATLPATILAAQKARIRAGDATLIKELWNKKDRTFLAMDFEWSERNKSSCLEWGYAAVRCAHLDAIGVWPPDPEKNYRKGHYVVSEYADAQHNKRKPNHPWAFGETKVIPKTKLPDIIQSIITSLIGPDSETSSNQLVLVVHGKENGIEYMGNLNIKLPHNVITINTASFERGLFNKGHRGPMVDGRTGIPRKPSTILSLKNTLRSLYANLACEWNCSGNDAFACLLVLQLLVNSDAIQIPRIRSQTILRPFTMMHPANTGHTSGSTPRINPPLIPYSDESEITVE